MYKRKNFLVTENGSNDIININTIISIEKERQRTVIYMIDKRYSNIENATPEEVLDIILGGRK